MRPTHSTRARMPHGRVIRTTGRSGACVPKRWRPQWTETTNHMEPTHRAANNWPGNYSPANRSVTLGSPREARVYGLSRCPLARALSLSLSYPKSTHGNYTWLRGGHSETSPGMMVMVMTLTLTLTL